MGFREEFNRKRDFVTVKPVKISGQAFVAGQPFDKSLVSTRLLRQLYDGRYLGMLAPAPYTSNSSAENNPAATEPAAEENTSIQPRTRRKRRAVVEAAAG